MKQRCYNENNPRYDDYGGRGIRICNEWLNEENGFLSFYNWSIKNGYKKGLTLDRRDNDGNYEPSNCRWVTHKIQQNNKRNSVLINIDGVEKTPSQWSEITGLSAKIILDRFNNGFNGDDIVSTEIDQYDLKIGQSGHRGIVWDGSRCSWQVYYGVNKERSYVGRYKKLTNAIKAQEIFVITGEKVKEKDM
jgi:hypothetical protein